MSRVPGHRPRPGQPQLPGFPARMALGHTPGTRLSLPLQEREAGAGQGRLLQLGVLAPRVSAASMA